MFGKSLTLFALLGVAACVSEESLKQPIPLERALEGAVETQETCKPGETFMKDCNYCSCTPTGVLRCTFKDCEAFRRRPLQEEKTSANVDQDQCTPGETFMKDCNSCRCTKNGFSLCTMKDCTAFHQAEESQAVKSKRSVDYNEKCTPGEIFKRDCNTCRCTKNSVLICTLMECQHTEESLNNYQNDRSETGSDVEESKCKPGESYKKDCNDCHCSAKGVEVCTMMRCEESEPWGPLYVTGDKCSPNQFFYSECNECKCNEEGTNAICTFKACRQP